MKFVLRNANINDLGALALAYLKCYSDANQGILPASLIAQNTLAKSNKKWRGEFVEQITDADRAIFIVENDIGDIVGFANCGAAKTRNQKHLGQGELFNLYIESAHQGFGLGKALMLACARWLISRGIFSGGVWINSENGIGRRFCEDLGGRVVAKRKHSLGGHNHQLIAIAWDDFYDAAQLEAAIPKWGASGAKK